MGAAGEPRVRELETAVLHHVEPGIDRGRRRGVVLQAELEPDRAGPGCERVVHDARQIVGAAEHVDEVDRLGKVIERRVHVPPEDL